MKNVMMSLTVFLASLMSPQTALADHASGPLWTCQIEAELDGFEAGVFVVVKSLEGEGEMRCQSIDGAYHKTFLIRMEITGLGLGFGYSEPKNLHFLTGDVGVTDPGYLYGKYNGGLTADGTLVDIGGTVGLGVAFSKRGASVRGVLAGGESEGLLGAVTGSVVRISPRK
jgi:hypothetical protein